MIHWNVHVCSESAADRPENRSPIQNKHVHSSESYQQATYQKYDRHGHKSPSLVGMALKGNGRKISPKNRKKKFDSIFLLKIYHGLVLVSFHIQKI